MSRHVSFITPENIEVRYELAGIGSRFMAALIDHLIQIAAILVLILIANTMTHVLSFSSIFGGGPTWISALLGIAVFVVMFGYFVLFELTGGGRTPGKRLTGLRVVRDGGYPIDPFSSVVRNLVRIVDLALPPPYGAGLLSVFFSKEYKRIGDYAAGTIVIKERPPSSISARVPGTISPVAQQFLPLIGDVDALTPEEFQVVRRFVERRHDLDIATQTHLAMRIALPLMAKLGINLAIPVQWHYADLLEAIERKYTEERGLLV